MSEHTITLSSANHHHHHRRRCTNIVVHGTLLSPYSPSHPAYCATHSVGDAFSRSFQLKAPSLPSRSGLITESSRYQAGNFRFLFIFQSDLDSKTKQKLYQRKHILLLNVIRFANAHSRTTFHPSPRRSSCLVMLDISTVRKNPFRLSDSDTATDRLDAAVAVVSFPAWLNIVYTFTGPRRRTREHIAHTPTVTSPTPQRAPGFWSSFVRCHSRSADGSRSRIRREQRWPHRKGVKSAAHYVLGREVVITV